MKENSKRTIKIIIIIFILLVLAFILGYTVSKYIEKRNGNLSLSVAKPICNLVVENENFTISNTEAKSLYFTVNNFDGENNISDVGMKYSITIVFPEKFVTSSILNYKLYKINDDSEEEVNIVNVENGIKTVESTFTANSKQSLRYRLEILYNSEMASGNITDTDIENFRVSLGLQSTQVEPEGSSI